MDGHSGDNFDTFPRTRRGVRTPTEVRRLAYQLWAFECGRNCRAVARILHVADYNIERWAKREGWAERADAELTAIMPDLVKQSASNLRLAAYHASRRLLALLNDPAPIPSREVDALVKAIAIGGFGTVGKSPLPAVEQPVPETSAVDDFDELVAAHHRRLGLDA
jgi:hypothetical protein